MAIDSDKVHISSLVIQCLPSKLIEIVKKTTNFDYVEVAAHDPAGKIVAVLETKTEQEILVVIDQLSALPGVLATTMVYHEVDC